MFDIQNIRNFRNEAEYVLNPPKELGSIAFLGYARDNSLNVLICEQNTNNCFYINVNNSKIVSNFDITNTHKELIISWIVKNRSDLISLASIMRNREDGYDELALKINEYVS